MDFEQFLSKRFGENWNVVFTDGMKALNIELMTAAYNQALEDAANECKYAETNSAVARTIKQQILSLKKQ